MAHINIVPIDAEQLQSIEKIQAMNHKPKMPIGMLSNVRVYEYDDGTFQIELQDNSILQISDMNTSTMDLYLEHFQQCTTCLNGQCDQRPPPTRILVSQPTALESLRGEMIATFEEDKFCGLTNKVRKVGTSCKE